MRCPVCGADGKACVSPNPDTNSIPVVGMEVVNMDNKNVYTSEERLYLNENGAVVPADSPEKLTLLVGAGGSIPMARAQELGLAKPDKAEKAEETKAVEKPASNKAITNKETK